MSKTIKEKVKNNDLSVKEFMQSFIKDDDKFISHAIDPFLSGIWAGDISDLSARSTLNAMMPFLKDESISYFEKSAPRSPRVKRYVRYLKGKDFRF